MPVLQFLEKKKKKKKKRAKYHMLWSFKILRILKAVAERVVRKPSETVSIKSKISFKTAR